MCSNIYYNKQEADSQSGILKYYRRKSVKFGNKYYCDGCTDHVMHCRICEKKEYLDNVESTYHVCPGKHIQSWVPSPQVIEYKLCIDCDSCSLWSHIELVKDKKGEDEKGRN